MTDLFQEPSNATPLGPAERNGLRQHWITTRADLNEAEQANIITGEAWARQRLRRLTAETLLREEFATPLHKRMFGEVWGWAGHFRQFEVSIGIAAHRIAAELPMMFDNVRYWVAHNTYSSDETAVRLHHRLVVVHPFANGNGRHSRLMADLLVDRLGSPPFTWGSGSLTTVGDLRTRYIAALQAADNHDIGPLLTFARS